MSSGNDDADLTRYTLGKIVNAMARGTLSSRIYIRRLPTQIVLENTTEADRAWVARLFPGEIEDRDGYAVRKVGTARVEEVRYVARLREQTEDDVRMQHRSIPRLEVWGIQVPHVCRHFTGHASAKGAVWKCSAYNCGKRITKTKARELGLLP